MGISPKPREIACTKYPLKMLRCLQLSTSHWKRYGVCSSLFLLPLCVSARIPHSTNRNFRSAGEQTRYLRRGELCGYLYRNMGNPQILRPFLLLLYFKERTDFLYLLFINIKYADVLFRPSRIVEAQNFLGPKLLLEFLITNSNMPDIHKSWIPIFKS